MYTSSLASRSGVGPQIPTDGLIGLFDFGNPKSYPGTGTTVYNLAPSGGFSGTLDGSPTFVSQGADSHIQFSYGNLQEFTYTVPKKGATTTFVTVFELGSTYDANTPITLGYDTAYQLRCLTTNDQNSPFQATIIVGNNLGSDTFSFNTNKKTMIFVGNDNNQDYIYGSADNYNLWLPPHLISSISSVLNWTVVLGGWITNLIIAGDMKLYYHMCYNRLLSQSELANIYSGLKMRYNLD